ncbi:MAG: glutamyl-tRNA reductase [Planctomycetes bacterium]|nr:glutamyl-tRNA reductase [Planctomycetota bacterium]
MNVSAIGCSFREAPVDLRERVAFDDEKLERALKDLAARYGCEAVVISTCNRVELYLAKPEGERPPDCDLIAEFLGEFHRIPARDIRPHLYEFTDSAAVQHLFRVTASLDSLIVGEGQIAGQVRKAFESSRKLGVTGPLLNALFPHAVKAAKKARTDTGISQGHVSVSSVAVDYVRQVFERFDDKTILVIGAGKMGRLTLNHLRELKPKSILVTNRSPEKALEVAAGCSGTAVPWDQLDDALIKADVVLSTTGAPEPIVTRRRFDGILPRRTGGPMVILDIAVPRDFDPRIHDGETAFLFNIDDLKRIREQTIGQRQKHIAPAEAIVEQERKKFVEDWTRRRNGPVIAKLTQDCDLKRKAVLEQLLGKLNGKLSEAPEHFLTPAPHGSRLAKSSLPYQIIHQLRDRLVRQRKRDLFAASSFGRVLVTADLNLSAARQEHFVVRQCLRSLGGGFTPQLGLASRFIKFDKTQRFHHASGTIGHGHRMFLQLGIVQRSRIRPRQRDLPEQTAQGIDLVGRQV